MKKSVFIKIFVVATIAVSIFALSACVETGNYDISSVNVAGGSVNWSPLAEAESYKVELGDKTFNTTTSKISVNGFEPGQYTISITPIVNGKEQKSTSKVIAIAPSATNLLHLAMPVAALNNDSLELTWGEVEFAEGYDLALYKDGVDEPVYVSQKHLERSVLLQSRLDGPGAYRVEVSAVSEREFYVASEKAVIEFTAGKLATIEHTDISFDESKGRLSWDAVPGADYYEMIIFFNGREKLSPAGKRYTSSINYFDFTKYFYNERGDYKVKVLAKNNSAAVLDSDEANLPKNVDVKALEKPLNVAVEDNVAGSHKLLKWTKLDIDSADNSIVYHIEVTASNDFAQSFEVINASQFDLTANLTELRSYEIQIYATDNLKRYASSDKTTPIAYNTARVLGAPQNLSFNADTATLSWAAATDAEGYDVVVDPVVGGGSSAVKAVYTVDKNTLSLSLADKLLAGSYKLSVIAKGNGLNRLDSQPSTQLSARKLAAPVVPTLLNRKLKWDAVDGATGYVVKWTGTQTGTGPVTGTEYALSLTEGKYRVSVQAVSDDAATVDSNPTSYGKEITQLAATNQVGIRWADGILEVQVDGGAVKYLIKAETSAGAVILTETEAVAADGRLAVNLALGDGIFAGGVSVSVKVNAVGNGSNILDSDWQTAGTLNKLAGVSDVKIGEGNKLTWTGTSADVVYNVYYDGIAGITGLTAAERKLSFIKAGVTEITVTANIENGKNSGGFARTFYLESAKSAPVEATCLSKPSLRRVEKRIEWDSIALSSGYAVSIKLPGRDTAEAEVTVSTLAYAQTLTEAGGYAFYVRALGNGTDILDSETAVISHTAEKLVLNGGLRYENGSLYFNQVDVLGYEVSYTLIVNGVTLSAEIKGSPVALTGLNDRNAVSFKANGDGFNYLDSESAELTFDITRTVLPKPALTLAADTAGKTVLKWNAIDLASGYELSFVGSGATYKFVLTPEYSSFDLRETYSRISAFVSGDFVVRIKALGAGELIIESEESDSVNVKFLAAPSSLIVSSSSKLTWIGVSGRGSILQVINKGVTSSYITEAGVAEFDLRANLIAGDYSVAAITEAGAVGEVDSKPSATVSGIKLSAVSNIKIENKKVSWDAVPYATSYTFYVVNTAGDIIGRDDITGANWVEYNFSALGTVRCYVTAHSVSNANYIDSDNSLSLTLSRLATPKLSSPAILNNVLRWDAVAGADGYNIIIIDAANKQSQTNVSLNEYRLTLKAGTYQISVQARGNKSTLLDSVPTNNVEYIAKLDVPLNVKYDNGIITWENVTTDPLYVDVTYELSINGGTAFTLTGNSLILSTVTSVTWHDNALNTVKIRAVGKTPVEGGPAEFATSDWGEYPILCKIYVSITFETDGGTVMDTLVYQKGSNPKQPADPEKPNYKFGGWFKNSDCTVQFSFNEALNNDITIYAKWNKIIDRIEKGESFKKTVYEAGDSFSAEGGKLWVVYKDGSREKVNVTEAMCTGYNMAVADVQNVTITYTYDGKNWTVSSQITVNPKFANFGTLTPPAKTSYAVGETLDLTGGSIAVNFGDGSSQTIALTDKSITVTGFDSSSTGSKAVTLTYTYSGKTHSTSFNVTVA